MASPGGYSGWDGGGASHQFTLDIGEKALDNMTFLKSPSNFSSFKVFIYICWFPIYSPAPPPLTTRVVVMRVAWGYWKTSPSFQGVIEELLCLPCYSYSRQCRLHGEIIYGGTRWIEDDRSATFSEYIFLFPACLMISHWLTKNAELNSVF